MAQLDSHIASNRHFEFFWFPDPSAFVRTPTSPPRDVAFNEIEFAVPAKRGPDCVRELRQLMLTQHKDALWPLEYRTVKPDDPFLSPEHGRATVTISAHQPAERPYRP